MLERIKHIAASFTRPLLEPAPGEGPMREAAGATLDSTEEPGFRRLSADQGRDLSPLAHDRMQRLAYTDWMEAFFPRTFGKFVIDLVKTPVADNTSTYLSSEIQKYAPVLYGASLTESIDVPQVYDALFKISAPTAVGAAPTFDGTTGAFRGTVAAGEYTVAGGDDAAVAARRRHVPLQIVEAGGEVRALRRRVPPQLVPLGAQLARRQTLYPVPELSRRLRAGSCFAGRGFVECRSRRLVFL